MDYESASTPELLRRCGLTRGALYHHFKDKRAVFEEVFRETSGTVQSRVEAAATRGNTPMECLLLGSRAYLAAASDPELVKIYLITGPAVLGWKRWREIDAEYSFGSLRRGLAEWLGADDEALALAVSGAFNELAVTLAEPSSRLTITAAYHAIERVLTGLDRWGGDRGPRS